MPAAEAEQIRIGRVRTNTHPMLHGQGNGALHGHRIGRMKAASQVGLINQRHGMGVITHIPHAEAFTHVAIQQDRFHSHQLSGAAPRREACKNHSTART